MKFKKDWAKKFTKDGYILFNNLINKKELKCDHEKIKLSFKKTKTRSRIK